MVLMHESEDHQNLQNHQKYQWIQEDKILENHRCKIISENHQCKKIGTKRIMVQILDENNIGNRPLSHLRSHPLNVYRRLNQNLK